MKKILSIFAAMLLAVAVNATVTNVSPTSPYDHDALRQALYYSAEGDTIVLAAGTYEESNSDYIAFKRNNVVMVAEGADVIIKPHVSFRVRGGARAELNGVKIDASELTTLGSYENIFEVHDATAGNCWVLKNCEVYGNSAKTLLRHASGKTLDSVIIDGCYIHNNPQAILRLQDASLKGVIIKNSTFAEIANGGSFWCAPMDISTTAADAKVVVDHCTFYHNTSISSSYADVTVGYEGSATSDVTVSNCIIAQPEAYAGSRAINFTNGGVVKNCLVFNYTKSTNGIQGATSVTNCIYVDPQFVNAAEGNYNLGEGSPALTAAEDGGAIGDPRWVPAEEEPALPQIQLIGEMNSWGGEDIFTPAEDNLTASLTIHLDRNANYGYGFKLNVGENTLSINNGQEWYHFSRTAPSAKVAYVSATSEPCWIEVHQSADYTLTWTYADSTLTVTYPEIQYFLVGSITGWQLQKEDEYLFAASENEGEFALEITLAAGNEFKVVSSEEKWYPEGNDNNYVVDADHAGDKTILFRPAGDGGEGWHYGYIYIAANEPAPLEAPDAAPTAPTVPEAQVKAVYSATYQADCNFGEWSSGTQYTQDTYGKKYVTTNSGYFGLEFTGMNCASMEKLHLDAWVAADASIRVVPIHGGTEVGVTVNLEGQKWNSIDIALSEFEGVTNWSNVYQIKIDNAANLTFWLNNLYFYTTVAPTVDLEDGYYIIGLKSWSIYDLTAEDLFAANPDNAAEYVITKTLTEGKEFKVVSVANNTFGTWYPAEGGNYAVDFAHAGEDKAIYFRPDYSGGDDWHAHCIFVAADESNNPWETWFAVGDTWNTETESYLEWDEDNEKATIHINVDKNGQWRAQAKYHGPVAEAGKYYRVALKLKANHNIQNVTIKYQDNVEMMYVDDAALEADVEYVFDKKAAGKANGNGIMVLDFGFAKSGDIIEIYDVVIEETAAPDLEDGYYIIGLHGWDIFDLTADDKFAVNPDNEAEYVLADVTLAANDEFKVVAVANSALGTWYPAEGGNYKVTANQAGERDIYFRPDYQGGEGWHAGCIYVYVEDEPVADCDWDELDWVVDATAEQTFGSQFKVCAGDPAPDVVNVQASFGTETGIYMRFNAADFSVVSLPADKYATQGAGILLYVSAFVDKETDVTIVTGGDTYEFTVYNAKGMNPTTAISNTTVADKALKVIENGQLYIILNGVRYNAQGQME